MDDMNDKEKRPEILGMIETVLRAENPDLPNLWFFGQARKTGWHLSKCTDAMKISTVAVRSVREQVTYWRCWALR
ncbi:hypothetical protein CEP88_09460 [Roseobacter denitrificans]|nr:hypothetical protein CEP88_09460 [Roseobacter denitrificans]SFG05247.1 hypothetical protein SAMN05443635_106182 [Roseobacter denitrificans OCh 114]